MGELRRALLFAEQTAIFFGTITSMEFDLFAGKRCCRHWLLACRTLRRYQFVQYSSFCCGLSGLSVYWKEPGCSAAFCLDCTQVRGKFALNCEQVLQL
jgi:hypothetical protein